MSFSTRQKIWIAVALILFFICTRFFFMTLPAYAVTYFDEAITGLMGMHLLRGEFPVFYWGCPYLGPLEALFAAFFFFISGDASTFALRLSPLLAYLIYGWALLAQARFLGKKEVFNFCLLFLLFPPYYLLHFSLTPIGDYMNTVMLGSLMMLLTSSMILDEKRLNLRNVFFLGILSGFSFWTFIQTAPVILACHIILLFRMRFRYFGMPLFLSFAGFILGGLPFWVWNMNHGFLTFAMKVTGADPGSFPEHVRNYFEVLRLLLGDYSLQPEVYRIFTASLAGVVLMIIPCLLFCGKGFISRLKKPDPLLLLVVAFAGNSMAYIVSSHGELQLPRYLLPLYSSLPLLFAFALSLVCKGRVFVVVSTVLILLMSLPENIRFSKSNLDPAYENKFTPRREELNELLGYLKQNNINHLYGAYCFTQILTFESKESVIAADYSGFRNLDYLREADRDPSTALIAEDLLASPDSASLESTLGLLTRNYQKKKCGRFTVFHDFNLKPVSDSPLPPGNIQGITVSDHQQQKSLLCDGVFETAWETDKPMDGKEWMTLFFVKPVRLSRVLLIPGPDFLAFPRGLRVEGTDTRGQRIRLAEAKSICGSFKVFNGKPRLFGKGETEILLDSENELTSLTFFQTGEDPFYHWKIGEVILFEKKQEKPLLISKVPAIPQGEFLVTTPGIYLENYYERLKDLRTIPLYPSLLTYLHWARVWDYDSPARFLDMDSDLLFVLPSDHLEHFRHYLQTHGVVYRLRQENNLACIETQSCGIPRGLKPQSLLSRIKIADFFNGRPVFEVSLPPSTTLYGFKLACAFSDFKWKELNVEYSDAGGSWRPLSFSSHKAYWADELILESCGEGSEVHFNKPVLAEKIRFILPSDCSTSRNLENFCESFLLADFTMEKDRGDKRGERSGAVAVFDEILSLDSFTVNPAQIQPGHFLELHAEFSWLKRKTKKMPVSFFLHALDSTGRTVFQLDRDLEFDRRPSDLKQNFERKYFIRLPDVISDKSLRVVIGLYDPETGKRAKPVSTHPVDMRAVELQEISINRDV